MVNIYRRRPNYKRSMDERQLKARLDEAPSSFQTLEFVKRFGKESTQLIINKIQREFDECSDFNEMEDIRDKNLIAFLSFTLGDIKSAYDINKNVMERDNRNINAVVCRAWFHWYRRELSECNDMCKKLETLKEDTAAYIIAKWEVGYSWARLGTKNYPKAAHLYEEVLSEVSKCPGQSVPVYYICAWKFGLALATHRQLNFNNLHSENLVEKSSIKERCNKVLHMCIEIIETKEENIDKLKGRSYILLGDLLYWIKTQECKQFVDDTWLERIPGSIFTEKIKHCYQKGFILRHDDIFVLEKYSKYLRLTGQIDKAIEICQDALVKRETSTLHHYLAIALRLKLENVGAPRSSKGKHRRTQRSFSQDTDYAKPGQSDGWKRGVVASFTQDLKPGHVRNLKPAFDPCSEQDVSTMFQDEPYTKMHEVDSGVSCAARETEKSADVQQRPLGCSQMTSQQRRHQYEYSKSAPKPDVLTKLIKSPKNVRPLPPGKIGQVISHLDKAVEIDVNTSARYDKGLVLRAAGKIDEAMDVFKSLFCSPRTSLIQLSNSYEQVALCLTEKYKDERDKNVLERVEMDIKGNLQKSLEIACIIASRIQIPTNRLPSFTSLKCLLEGKELSKNVAQELAQLNQKVHNFKEAIGWFKQALEIETDPKAKAATCMDISRTCIDAKNYNEAILYIDMVLCFPDGICRVEKDLLYKANIEGGMEAFENGQKELASIRLKRALNYQRTFVINDNSELSAEGDWYDIFIFCNQTKTDDRRRILELLRGLGLCVTCNAFLRNSTVFGGNADIMDMSNHALIVPGEGETPDGECDMFTNMAIKTQEGRNFGNIVVIRESETVPTMFKAFPSMTMDAIVGTNCGGNEGMKQLLLMLSSGK